MAVRDSSRASGGVISPLRKASTREQASPVQAWSVMVTEATSALPGPPAEHVPEHVAATIEVLGWERAQTLVQCALMVHAPEGSRPEPDQPERLDAPGAEPDPPSGPVDDRGGGLGFYDVVHRRRDVRAEFSGEPVDERSSSRVLGAAHSAPSVGLSQPWDFVLVADHAVRRAFWEHVQSERSDLRGLARGGARRALRRHQDRRRPRGQPFGRGHLRPRPGCSGVSSAATPSPTPACTRCASPSRTCGWPAPPRDGAWGGCRSTASRSCASCSASPPPSVPWRGCASGPVTALQETPDLERHGWRARLPLARHCISTTGSDRDPAVLRTAARESAPSTVPSTTLRGSTSSQGTVIDPVPPAAATTPKAPFTLAIDIGGTGLKASVLDATGAMVADRVVVKTTYPVPADEDGRRPERTGGPAAPGRPRVGRVPRHGAQRASSSRPRTSSPSTGRGPPSTPGS